MRTLKAIWKDEGEKGRKDFCVDDRKDGKDWLSEVPKAASGVPLEDAQTTDVRLANMRRVLESDRELRVMTGYGHQEFRVLYRSFVRRWAIIEGKEIERRRQCQADRAKKGEERSADRLNDHHSNIPGNRCKLHPAYVLLLDLVRKYTNHTQDQLGLTFGIDQAAVCRYIKVADHILSMMLPTPHRFMDALRNIDTHEKFAALFPENMKSGTLMIDGTHVRFERPGDKDVRDAMYSGKKKTSRATPCC